MSHPVVLIHGMWCTGANFARLRGLLEGRGYKCHTPTLPAHEIGAEHPEVGNKSLKEYLSYLEDYIRSQNFSEPPVLLGHSMGGLLAQQLAARIQPFALVLLTPAPQGGINGISISNLMAFVRSLARWGFWRKPHKPSEGRAAASVYNGLQPQRQAETYKMLVHESGRVAFEIGFWWCDTARAARVDHRAVRCPVYIVSAGRDSLTPAPVVRKVASLYPQAALRHYPERSHWVLDDNETEEMAADIANWLQGQEQRAAALRRA